MKKGEGWCVFQPCGWPLWYTARYCRGDCLRATEKFYGDKWAKLRRRGFTVRKVKLVEVSR